MEANRPDAVLFSQEVHYFTSLPKSRRSDDKESSEIKSLADNRNLEGRSLEGAQETDFFISTPLTSKNFNLIFKK